MRSLASHEMVILRLRPEVAQRLREQAARKDAELETILEGLVTSTFADDRTPRERQMENSTLDASPTDRKEIDRLVERQKEVR